MKAKTLISVIAISALPMFAPSAAQASPIYIKQPSGPNTTGSFEQLGLGWTALSSYTDANGNGTVDAGETVVDTVTKNYGAIANNYGDISSLIPSTSSVRQGFGNTWGLYFDYTVTGTVLSASGSQILANYTSGTINIYYDDYVGQTSTDAGRNIAVDPLVMSIGITGSGGAVANFLLFGTVTSVKPSTFYFANGTDFSSLLSGNLVINTRIDTNLDTNQVPSGTAGGTLTRTSTLNGSAQFDVPEPSVLALFGLGLVGLVAARRPKKAA